MADIAAAIAKHGNIWSLQTNADMEAIFEPLHQARAASFKDTVKVEKALKYGLSGRHRIDVYSPTSSFENASASRPVVVFFHGGAFIAGDNDITPSMHAHIGNFFASNGCICALATYRVIPEAVYPSGAYDISQAIKWIKDNAQKYGGNPSNITAIGQSSGGAHLASAIFNGKFKALGIELHGTILLSAPLWYDLRQKRRKKNMKAYHASESEEEILKKTGVAQFQNAKLEDISPTNILLMLGEFDPNEIVDGNFMFVAEYRKKLARLPVIEVMKGQNHISYFLGLGLQDDKLGRRILDFLEVNLDK